MSASISCIVPVYNGARFLAEALESVLAQTLPPNEIIVVDDGSTDATAEVVRAYIRHVFYVRQPHAGAASARNCGIGLATSDFLSFLDADGLWHAEKLARQMHALEANPAAGFCITYLQEFWVEESAHQRSKCAILVFPNPCRAMRVNACWPGATLSMPSAASMKPNAGVKSRTGSCAPCMPASSRRPSRTPSCIGGCTTAMGPARPMSRQRRMDRLGRVFARPSLCPSAVARRLDDQGERGLRVTA